mgnify:FL=1
MHQSALDQIAAIQDECRSESMEAASNILAAHFPHKTVTFFKRNLDLVLAISADDFARVIGYPDPTGEKAVRNVLAQQAEEVAA